MMKYMGLKKTCERNFMQIPNAGELWLYQYVDGNEKHEELVIEIDRIIESVAGVVKYIRFSYIDTWEEDEMSWKIFQKYCKKVDHNELQSG